MYEINVDPRRLLIWHHENTTPDLEEIALNGKLGEIPRVPVFELSQQYKDLGDYVLLDGHKRREAAIRANSDLPANVLECADDFRLFEEYNLPEYFDMTPEQFTDLIKLNINLALRYISDKNRTQTSS